MDKKDFKIKILNSLVEALKELNDEEPAIDYDGGILWTHEQEMAERKVQFYEGVLNYINGDMKKSYFLVWLQNKEMYPFDEKEKSIPSEHKVEIYLMNVYEDPELYTTIDPSLFNDKKSFVMNNQIIDMADGMILVKLAMEAIQNFIPNTGLAVSNIQVEILEN